MLLSIAFISKLAELQKKQNTQNEAYSSQQENKEKLTTIEGLSGQYKCVLTLDPFVATKEGGWVADPETNINKKAVPTRQAVNSII